jgi:hypothetical protein
MRLHSLDSMMSTMGEPRWHRAISMALAGAGYAIASWWSIAQCEDAKVNFEDQVKPIFREHCSSCHNANDQKGGLALDTFQGVIAGGSSGEVVLDGDPSSSRLYQLMTHAEEPVMPPEQDKLADEKLNVIKQWIEGGLLENSGSKRKNKAMAQLAMSTTAADQPPANPTMPVGLLRQPVVTSTRTSATSALAASPWAPLIAVSGQRQIVLYHSESGQLLGILPFPEGDVQSLRFSRDGAYLFAGGGKHGAKGMAALYDVATGKRLTTVGDELDIALGADINDSLTKVALGGPLKIVRIVDVQTDQPLFELKKHTDWVYAVAFSPDGVLLASGDRSGGIHVWEAETGRLYLDLVGHQGAVRSLAFQPDGNILASASEDGTIRYWEMFEGKQVRSTAAHGRGVMSISYLRDGRHVSAGGDGVVKFWNVDGSEIVQLPPRGEGVLEAVACFDGKRIVSGDWSGAVQSYRTDAPQEAAMVLAANPPSLNDRLAALQQQLVQSQAAAAAASQQREAAASALSAAQQAAQSADASAVQAAQQAGQLDSEIKAIQTELESIASQRAALQADAGQKEQAATTARSGVEPLMQAVMQGEVTVAQHDAQLVAVQQQVAALQAQLQSIQMQRDAEAAKLQPLVAQRDAASTAAENAEAEAAAAKEALNLFMQAYPQP